MSVHRIALHGGPEGTTNAYVLPERRVLIDPGPPTEQDWEALTAGIQQTALSWTDIEHVFVTHWHIDHAGLAVRAAEQADAEIHLHDLDAALVGQYESARQRRLATDITKLRQAGTPREKIHAVHDSDTPSPLPATYPVRRHTEGDVVAGLEYIHLPGHTLGHAGLLDREASEDDRWHAFVGDALLPDRTPNIGGGDFRLDNALVQYLDALRKLSHQLPSNTATTIVYAGHGGTFDPTIRIAATREHHRQRLARIRTALDDTETVTPWELATTLFGELAGIHVKLGVGEARAHLEYLRSVGEVELQSHSPHVYVPVE